MIQPGQLLGNRYEILSFLGSGGMAHVYKARCKLLGRFVAVKVLRPEYADDAEFLKRFRVEAQAAASLSHNNIVGIYDVGIEDDVYYIVMEYVEGGSLKEYVSQHGALPWYECVEYAAQICRALEHAHARNIIHRDIKPHNILVSKDGVLKVADFGIARAATGSQTMTAESMTMGSVHYFSPEQARGGYTDERSDIYSLGIVMYEMLTAHLPFTGDNPVSVALKHIQDSPLPPSRYTTVLPAVEHIVMRAISKDTRSRYASAAAMLDDLSVAARDPNHAFQNAAIDDATRKVQPVRADKAAHSSVERVARGGSAPPRSKSNKPAAAEEPVARRKKRSGGALTLVLALLASGLIIAATILIAGWFTNSEFSLMDYVFGESTVDEIDIPDLVGQNYEDLRPLYFSGDILLNVIERVESDTDEKGVVLSQEPPAGRRRKQLPVTIDLVISAGLREIRLGDYKRYKNIEAKLELQREGLRVIEESVESEEYAAGIVIRTEPPVNTTLKAGDTVKLYVSSGAAQKSVVMPNLVDATWQQALVILDNNNLLQGNIRYEPSDKSKDTVLDQSVRSGYEVAMYTKIDLVLSEGLTSPEESEEPPPSPIPSEEPTPAPTAELPPTPTSDGFDERQQTPTPTPTPDTPQPTPDEEPTQSPAAVTPTKEVIKPVPIPVPTDQGDKVSITVKLDGKDIHTGLYDADHGDFIITLKLVMPAKLQIYYNGFLGSEQIIQP